MAISHIELMLVRGVYPAPSDPNSAEAQMLTLDLLDPNGLSLEPDGWSPNIPALKNGGTWVESAISDGRQLLATAVGDVTETMSLVCSNTNTQTRFAILKRLGQLQQSVWDFANGYQIDPVYIQWHAACGAGKQYALIKTMEYAQDIDSFDSDMWSITLTVTREAYWRGVWPGGNPLEWTFSEQGKVRGSAGVEGYDYQDMGLYQNTNHFAYAELKNRHEWNNADYLTTLSKNYIDVENIPGDAPALCCLVAETAGLTEPQMLVARSTTPTFIIDRTGAQINQANILNVGDCDTGGTITKTVDATCGVISNNSNLTRYIGTTTIAISTTVSGLLRWSRVNGASGTRVFELNLNRGMYAAFLRCKQTNGSDGDVDVRLRVIESNGDNIQALDYEPMPLVTTASTCQNRFDTLYLGTFQIPFSGKPSISIDGRGLEVGRRSSGGGNVLLYVDARNNVASTRTLEFLDLILMPIDEAFATVKYPIGVSARQTVLDTTGYFSHGDIHDIALSADPVAPSPQIDNVGLELDGVGLTLIPNIKNRLYFIWRTRSASEGVFHSSPSSSTNDFTVRLNIVPRWTSIRDS